MSKTKLLAVIGCAITLATCGGGVGDVQSFITEYCNVYMPCCTKAGRSSDPTQCKALYNAFLGGATYNADSGQKCIDAMNAASSSATFCDDGGGSATSAACNSAISTGTKQPGDTCSQDSDCASSTDGPVVCNTSFIGSSETRICQVQMVGKLGDSPCVATINGTDTSYVGSDSTPPARAYSCNVASSLFCDGSVTPAKCASLKNVGDACTDDSSCAVGAYCSFSQQKCVALAAGGTACDSSSFTASCVANFYCDSTTSKCLAMLAEGASCTSSTQCASGECVNSACTSSASLEVQLMCAK